MARERWSERQRHFQELLRELRLGASLKQAELADKIGLGQADVSKIESGERAVSALELLDICAACGVEFEAFARRMSAELGTSIT